MVFPSQIQVDTGVENLTRVDVGIREAKLRTEVYLDELILRGLAIPVEAQRQPVVEKAGIETQVILLGGLPSQLRIGEVGKGSRCGGIIGEVVVTANADGGSPLIVVEHTHVTVASP